MVVTQNRNSGQSIQVKQINQAGQNVESAMQKADEELQKAKVQLDKTLKDLERSRSPEAIQKAQEELQKAMQLAQDEMQKAKAQFDKATHEIHTIQVGPGGAQFDVFGPGGGMGSVGGGGGSFSGGMGGFGGGGGGAGGFGRGAGRVIMDNRTGQMTVSGPVIMENISDPEAKELRDKEQECTDKIGKIIDHYNSTPATNSSDRAAIKIELQKTVGEQFDIRQQYRELQIKQLEKELARVRESIQNRNVNREQIIKRHIAQLLHEQEDMDF